MEKSRSESSAPNKSATREVYQPPQEGHWFIEAFLTEGGISLLIIFPLVVLYFLARAANLL